jgi:WD40 repeat protein
MLSETKHLCADYARQAVSRKYLISIVAVLLYSLLLIACNSKPQLLPTSAIVAAPPTLTDATAIAAATGEWTPTPWPTPTPFPTLAAYSTSPYSVQNLQFGSAVPLNKEAYDQLGDMTWSPDGQTLAYRLRTGIVNRGNGGWDLADIVLMDADSLNVRRLITGTMPTWLPTWSPTGDLIAYLDYDVDQHEGHIRIVDVATGRITLVTNIVSGTLRTPIPVWLSDTELLYYEDKLTVFNYATGQKSNLLDDLPLQPTLLSAPYLAASPKHNLIAIASYESLIILKREKGVVSLVKSLKDGLDYWNIAFSPDGKDLAYNSLARRLKIVSVIW